MASLWERFFGRKNASALDVERVYRDVYGVRGSATGKDVNVKTALEVSTVLACIRVISEGVAQVPLKVFQESADGKSRMPAKEHPLYNVLHRRPNPWQTSYEFRETLVLHAVLTGNFFAFINRVRGQVVELVPFEPSQVTVKRADDYTLTYEVTTKGNNRQVFPAETIWHVRGPSWNTWMGLESVYLAREAIGLAMATEEHHAKLHKHGARPGGVYSVEGTLAPEQYKKLAEWVEKNQGGSENAFRTMILDRNAKFQQIAMTGVDSQHLETRRYQVEEICRHFRVMPIMVGYSDKTATYASAEQMFLAHVVHTLSPWYERIEQSIDANLLTDADAANGLYAKFVEEGLLRGALADTATYLTQLTTNGIMTRNEARAKLDLNPLDGLDEPLTPANMTVGAEPPEPEPDPEPQATDEPPTA